MTTEILQAIEYAIRLQNSGDIEGFNKIKIKLEKKGIII